MTDQENNDDRDKEFLVQYGVSGNNTLTGGVIAIAVGLFGLLGLLLNSEKVFPQIVISISYWIVFLAGVWLYGKHQLYNNLSRINAKEVYPKFNEYLKKAATNNITKIPFIFNKKGEHHKEKFCSYLFLSIYCIASFLLWFAITLEVREII